MQESYYKSQHTGSFSKRRKKRARCADSYELRFLAGRKGIKIEGRVARLMGTLFPKLRLDAPQIDETLRSTAV